MLLYKHLPSATFYDVRLLDLGAESLPRLSENLVARGSDAVWSTVLAPLEPQRNERGTARDTIGGSSQVPWPRPWAGCVLPVSASTAASESGLMCGSYRIKLVSHKRSVSHR